MKKTLIRLAVTLFIIADLCVLLYPTVSKYVNSKNQSRVVAQYFDDVTGKGFKPVLVYSTSVNFTATVNPPEGKSTRYTIRIKPVSTKEARVAQVYLDVDMADGTIEKRSIVAAIRDQNNPSGKTQAHQHQHQH